jgi:hypothetical protein
MVGVPCALSYAAQAVRRAPDRTLAWTALVLALLEFVALLAFIVTD